MKLVVIHAMARQGWSGNGRVSVRVGASATGHNIRMAAIISPGQTEKTGYQGSTGMRRGPDPAFGDQGRRRGNEQEGEIA